MKKNSWIIASIFTFIILFLTIGYSAFNTDLEIGDILSYYKSNADIKITNISVDNVENNGLSEGELYDNNHINVSVSLPDQNSTITYLVDVTNFGGTYMVISKLEGLPSNLTYELSNYTLNKVICDDNNECVLGITKQLLLTIKYTSSGYDSTNTNYNLNIEFTFEEFEYTVYFDKGFGLPAEYQEVEYLESTGSQRINTKYLPKKNTRLEIDLSFSGTFKTGTSGTNAFVHSASGNDQFSVNFGAGSAQGNALFLWFDKSQAAGGSIFSLGITDKLRTNRNTMIYDAGNFSYGTAKKTAAVKTADHQNPFYIFGSSSKPFDRYNMKVYHLKLYESGELVAEYIPCYRISDGKTGMYNVVDRFFAPVIGTAEFNIGAEVTTNQENQGTMTPQKLRYNENTSLKLNSFSIIDKYFMWWNTDHKGQGKKFQDGENIVNLTDVSGTKIILYAQWLDRFNGAGTSESPYIINNIEDWLSLSYLVNLKNNSFENKNFEMSRNLDFLSTESYKDSETTFYGDINGDGNVNGIMTELSSGLGFPPIAQTTEFKGNFDGGNYTLSNLYIYNSTIGENQEPLNGALTSGHVSLFSKVNNGKISNIKVNGKLTSKIKINISGIVGKMTNGTIDNVENNSTVLLDCGSAGGMQIAGIVNVTNGDSQILNSRNTAKINVNDKTTNNTSSVGGIVSSSNGTLLIRNTFNSGEVSNGWRTGGIEGVISTNGAIVIMDKCYNTGKILKERGTNTSQSTYTAGLVGLVWADANQANYLYVINSYNNGEINSAITKNNSGLIGAVASRSSGYVVNSYNSGEVISTSSTSYASGIFTHSAAQTKKSYINNVFNYGSLSGTTHLYGIAYVAGSAYTINKAYYLDNVSTGSNKTNVTTSKTADEFNTQEFTDTLNSNLSNVNLDTLGTIKLATKYGVSLCPWKLGELGYPELEC